jgi:aminodeoxychorismate synthase component I
MKIQTLPNRHPQRTKMQLHSAFLGGWVHPADVFVQLYSNERNAFWLDGEFSPDSNFSVIGAGPLSEATSPSVSLETLSFENASDLPFSWRPGLVGLIAYEGESAFILADRAIVFDHTAQGLYFVGVFETPEQFEFWHQAALLRLGFSGGQVATYLHDQSDELAPAVAEIRHSSAEYIRMIEQAQNHIALGDVYQVCLTNEITVRGSRDALAVFLKLRIANPAPYSAFLKLGERTLVSSSPEQFIRVSNDGLVSSKPIKGTRPRGSNADQDVAIATELQQDKKERAENLMIVDLMRNDIGKVAEVGSVSVPLLFDVETYATVHQLVSTVTGRLAPGETAWSAILAAFPGGSLTGAPKIRAMEIIEALEQGSRGIYSGCVGYLASDGSAEFAMVIRSLVFEDSIVKIGVGGGITIDSDPMAELQETKLKAKALLTALNATDPWA